MSNYMGPPSFGHSFETARATLLNPGAPWMQNTRAVPGQPLTTALGVGIGAVLVILRRSPFEVLVVQKADVDDYEFSGMWSMPGGMVRCSWDSTLNIDPLIMLEDSLAKRVHVECGLEGVTGVQLSPIEILPPPVTCYTVKGTLRHTLVLPFLFTGPEPANFVAGDRSVRNPQWMCVVDALRVTAPANRLVLATLVWRYLTESERSRVTSNVDSAKQLCDLWAGEVGLPPTREPSIY